MKRYGIVGPAYPFRGGIAHYTSALYLALAEKNSVRLFSYRRQYPKLLFPGRTQLDQSSKPLSVPNQPILDPVAPWTWVRAIHEISLYQPDVLLVMWWNPFFAPMLGYMGRRLKRKLSSPVVFLCHNVLPHESSVLDLWLLRLAYGAPTHFLVQSDQEREQLRRIRGDAPVGVLFHPAQTFLISGMTHNRRQAQSELAGKGILDARPPYREFDSGNRRRLLLFFGHVRPYKGVDVLLRSMALVLEQLQVELLIVGEFYESLRKYEEMLHDLGLQDWVRIVDRYIPNEEVALFFEAADAVVLPYRTGTQSGIVPLAFQFERPVIVTRVGGIPMVVKEGRTGLLIAPEDPEELAAAIVRFYRDNLGDAFTPHLKAAAQELSWAALIDRIEAFLAAPAPDSE